MTERTYSLEEALKTQSALRTAAGLEPERFPVEAFGGMISDEIDALHAQGKSDDQIAGLIKKQSAIDISASDIASNYATPEQRSRGRE